MTTALGSSLAAAAVAAAQVEVTEDVSPGLLGFLVTLAVVLACIPLLRSMTAKVRGVRYRDRADDDAPDDDGPATDAAHSPVPPGDEPVDHPGEPGRNGRADA